MAGLEVIWSSGAEAELTKILEFYSTRNQSVVYPTKILSQIDRILAQIDSFP